MFVRPAALCLVALLLVTAGALASAAGRTASDGPQGLILLSGDGIELFDPGRDVRRPLTGRGSEPAFFPSGKTYAYIREGGCFPSGDGSCYTGYSVFKKSLAEKDRADPGRQVFRWNQFWLRAIDVGPEGRLFFSAEPGPGGGDRGRSLDIFSCASDGRDIRRLTDNRFFENDPAVSPDGRHIAFVRKVDGRGQIFSMRSDGSDVRRLTLDGAKDRLPSWSPDGRRVLYISQPAGENRFDAREIYVIGARGGEARRLTHNSQSESDPTYSPDGRSIAFLLESSLWTMGADGSAPHLLLRSPYIGGYEGGIDWGRHPRIKKAAAHLSAVPASAPAQVRDYDLGVVELPDAGPKGPIPVRLWGAIGVPDGPGPYPLVVVAHGRHGDDCPQVFKYHFEWPCWEEELRTDLGMEHLVGALAERGVAAVAPDLNGAFTIGWNDRSGNRHRSLWGGIVDRTVAELSASVAAGDLRFGSPLAGLDLSRPISLLAHSLSGADAVRYAGSHPISALLLLAPAFESGLSLPDVETAIVAARCDYDVPGQARRYFENARQAPREEPVFFVRLEGANHNYFNSTLSRLRRDDGKYLFGSRGCHRSQRLPARRQQGWVDRFASAFFATALGGATAPSWMRPGGPIPGRIDGLPVGYDRLAPGR